MATELLHDTEQDMACLVDPDAGRAFGPICRGELEISALDAFVKGSPVDLSTLIDFQVFALWGSFVEAMNTPSEPAHAPDGEIKTDAGTPNPPEPPATATEPPADTPPPADPAAPAAEQPATVEQPPPPPAEITCPTCDGHGTVAEGGNVVQCPTCTGSGKVLAPTD